MEKQVKELVEAMNSEIESDFSRFRELPHNPDSKGSSYEEELQNLLQNYFGGSYNFYTKPAILDEDLNVFDIFDTARGEQEFDVAGMYKQSKPQVVFDIGEMTYLPLPGIAQVFEIKSRLTKPNIEKDLEKLGKLKQLLNEEDRAPSGMSYEGGLSRPALCLIYDENQISDDVLSTLLQESKNWDLLLDIESNVLHLNNTTSLAEENLKRAYDEEPVKNFYSVPYGFVNFPVALSAIVNEPVGGIDSSGPLITLLQKQAQID